MIEYIRIAILDKLNTVIGYMDNAVSDALHYYDDNLHIYLQGTASTFEFTTSTNENGWFSKLKIGNHLSFRYLSRDYYFQIVSTEQTEDELKVTAYSACLELITETCPAYEAENKTFVEYLEAFDPAGVLTVGRNEIKDYSRACSWDGEATQLSRLYSLASNFDAEIEFIPALNDDYTLDKMIINIYHEHDDDNQGIGTNRINGRRLRYGKSLKGITKTSDITGLYTNILATGKGGITLAGYTPNEDGTAYVKKDDNGNVLYRKDVDSAYLLAPYAAKQFPSHVTGDGDDYILYRWSTDYTTQKRLFSKALSKLKSLSSPQVTYEIDASYGDYFTDGGSTDSTRYFYGNVGDTITVIDEEFEPALYLEARISELGISFTDPTKNKATFSNIDELERGVISAAVQEQITQAKSIANTAKASAESATAKASEAQTTAESASTAASAAQTTANTAKSTADTAKSTAYATATDLATNYSTTSVTEASIASAKTEAVSTAAEDATAKADAAESNAKTYADGKVQEVSNYFWHDNDGAHVSNDSTIGTDTSNLLLDDSYIAIRKGTRSLAEFTKNALILNGDTSGDALVENIGNDITKPRSLTLYAGVETSADGTRGCGKVVIQTGINNYADDDPTDRINRICRIQCDNTSSLEGVNNIEAPHTTIHTHDLIIDNDGVHGEGDTDPIVMDEVSVNINGTLEVATANVTNFSAEYAQVGGSTVLTASDVSSTYSATGTAPVNGKAIASAIPTADIDANTAARHKHANQSVLEGITAANVGDWNASFRSYDDTITDANNAPMGMCTVSGKTCSNLPDTANQYWLFTFFNRNANGIQFAKRSNQNYILYMRTKNNSGISAWKSITFA